MRFRAKVYQEKLVVLEGVLNALEKATGGATSTVMLHLSEGGLKFALPTHASEEAQAFAELQQEVLFAEYRIESQADNCILLEASLGNLARAFRSGRTAPLCQLKLTKRGGAPHLCLETRALEVDVTHDIPVKVLKAVELEAYAPPEVPTPEVQLELPQTRQLRTIAERLKSFDRYLFVDAAMSGNLTLRVQSGEATVKTFFTNLVPRFDGLDEETARSNEATVRLEGKRLAAILAFYALPCESAIACIVEGYSFIVHVFLAPRSIGSLTYYLPVGVDEVMHLNADA